MKDIIDSAKSSLLLRDTAAEIERLKDAGLCGVAIVIPPMGDPIKMVLAGTEISVQRFFQLVSDRMAPEQTPQPAIGFGSGMGR